MDPAPAIDPDLGVTHRTKASIVREVRKGLANIVAKLRTREDNALDSETLGALRDLLGLLKKILTRTPQSLFRSLDLVDQLYTPLGAGDRVVYVPRHSPAPAAAPLPPPTPSLPASVPRRKNRLLDLTKKGLYTATDVAMNALPYAPVTRTLLDPYRDPQNVHKALVPPRIDWSQRPFTQDQQDYHDYYQTVGGNKMMDRTLMGAAATAAALGARALWNANKHHLDPYSADLQRTDDRRIAAVTPPQQQEPVAPPAAPPAAAGWLGGWFGRAEAAPRAGGEAARRRRKIYAGKRRATHGRRRSRKTSSFRPRRRRIVRPRRSG